MITKFFLVVNSKGSVKAVKSRPSLDWDEISMQLELQLPNALFAKPQLSATIMIPEEAANPTQIEAAVMENIKDAIEQASNMEVKLSLVSNEIVDQ